MVSFEGGISWEGENVLGRWVAMGLFINDVMFEVMVYDRG
jgi:hypothetical protein